MTDERFQELKAELSADAVRLSCAMLEFSAQWKSREKEIGTMTTAQSAKMAEVCSVLDEANGEMQ